MPITYSITFKTDTNIWFDNSDVGQANMSRLQDTFKKIRTSFKVINEEDFRS